MKQVVVRVPDDLHERLKKSAEIHHRSLNSEVLTAVDVLVDRRDPQPEWDHWEAHRLLYGQEEG